MRERISGSFRIVLLTCLLQACGESPPPMTTMPSPSGPPCGVERWDVKTLADPDAARVDFVNVTRTTIGHLNELAAHCSDLPPSRTFAEEFHVYEVAALVQFAANEQDRDVHLALADPLAPNQTIVVEVVDPGCATTSPYLTTLANARLEYQRLPVRLGQRVTVRGVGFYDFAHGQTGRSQSCIELHPVIDVIGDSSGR
jgi:hypothetical protein